MTEFAMENLQENEASKDFIEIEIPYHVLQTLNSSNFNTQDLCRICLCTSTEEMFPMTSNKKIKNILADMFTSVTSIQVLEMAGLPKYICATCHSQLVFCYEFKMKCEKSEFILKSILKDFVAKEKISKGIISKNDSPEDVIKAEELKQENEYSEDIQYLEEFSDVGSDNDNSIFIVQDKNKSDKLKLDVTITDSSTLLKEVTSEKRKIARKNKLKHTCTFCPKKFRKIKLLKAHIKRSHNETPLNPFSCGQCKESFNSEHDLHLHSTLHSKNNVWKCNKCEKEFKEKSTLRRHIQRHMESKKHTCGTCDKSFTELYALRRHTRVHTGELIEKKHVCHICDKRYSESGLLAAHLAQHNGVRPCVCAVCGKDFPSRRLLVSHSRVHTELKRYACTYCDKRFRHESTRNTHHRTHTGDKPYVCSICGKRFIQNSNLTLHMRTHTGERPYTCSVCDRKFKSGSSLKSHKRRHTGEKPYSCPICDKRFARMDLSVHLRLHSGERPYQCATCPKRFINVSRLRDHCRVHTGEKPYECAVCTQRFPTKGHLVKHIKTHKNRKKESEQATIHPGEIIFNDCNQKDNDEKDTAENVVNNSSIERDNSSKEAILDIQEVPLAETEELVMQDDSNMNTELLVINNSEIDPDYQSNICLNTSGVNFVNNDLNFTSDVNLLTVNKGGVSISSDGTTVKLYQLDQSLVQIHSSGRQLTISKITSKMTTNF